MDKELPQGASVWSAEDLASVTQGIWLQSPPPGWRSTGLASSFKWLKAGDVFLSMDSATWNRAEARPQGSGKSWDTASRLGDLAAAGAAAAIIQRAVSALPVGFPVLRVADSIQAMLAMARAARGRFRGRLIAVTGTVGKTSTREMIRHVLARQGSARSTVANYNTRVGVPLMLAGLPQDVDYAILEMAISSMRGSAAPIPGPVSLLAKPHVAIITAIGREQTKDFPTAQDTAEFKSRIFRGLEPNGVAIIPRDSSFCGFLRQRAFEYGAARVLTFGSHVEADVRLMEAQLGPQSSQVAAAVLGSGVSFRVPLPGSGMIYNSLAALASVAALNGDWRRAAQDLNDYQGPDGRLQRYKVAIPGGFFELIDDSFNAAQLSMVHNFEVLALARPGPNGRRLAVLGPITGLGQASAEMHAELAEPLLRSRIDRVFTIGAEMLHLRERLPAKLLAVHAAAPEALAAAVLKEVRPGDVVSVKVSHFNPGFENLVSLLRAPSALQLPAATSKTDVRVVAASAARDLSLQCGPAEAITINVLGDLYFGEFYHAKHAQSGATNILQTRGYDYCLASFRPFLSQAHVNVANLEAALTSLATSPLARKKNWILRGDPEKSLQALTTAAIHAVTLGNNHTLDYGVAGLADTVEALNARQLRWLGAGGNALQADMPLRISVAVGAQSLSLALLSAFEFKRIHQEKYRWYAIGDRPGVASLAGAASVIRELKKATPETFVIVLPHWGENYVWHSAQQTKLAGELVDAGADLILGHGAHMFQAIEKMRGSLVAYSLGNFVFNSFGEYERRAMPPFSLLASLHLAAPGNAVTMQLRLYPILSDNLQTEFQPRFATDAEFDLVANLLETRNPALPFDGAFGTRGRDAHGHFLGLPLR